MCLDLDRVEYLDMFLRLQFASESEAGIKTAPDKWQCQFSDVHMSIIRRQINQNDPQNGTKPKCSISVSPNPLQSLTFSLLSTNGNHQDHFTQDMLLLGQ
jgi:hypothetical protein